jgi:hypothetical protein
MSFFPARRLATALAVGALVACGDPASPDTDVTQDIEVTNVFAAGASAGASLSRATRDAASVQISKIRLTVIADPSGTILFQKTYDVDPAQARWTLSFTAPTGESLRIVAELMSVTQGTPKVEYSGQVGPLTLNPCTSNCTPIPVKTYPGTTENLGASSVVISPDAPEVVEGATTNLTAAVAPTGPSYQVTWRSLTPDVATVSADGVVTGVLAGSAQIEAAVGPQADTVAVTVTAANTCVETAYTVGSTANGAWTGNDCVFAASGRHYDMYALTLAQQTSFTAQLAGPNGRRIQVRRAGTDDYVQVMANDAAMPPTANPLEVGYVLPAGSYVVEVVTPDGSTLGEYSLATTAGAATSCSVLTYIWPNVTINGSISGTDCEWPGGGGREDRYIILPDAGVRLAMSLSSSAFGASLNFRDDRLGPDSPTLAYDRQSTIGVPANVAYTTTFSGYHEIVVSHTDVGATGNYTLTLGTAEAANTCAAFDTDYGARMAVWETTDCPTTDGRVYDKYTFTTDEQTAFRLALASTAADKTAGVFKDGKEILEWAGSGTGDLNAAWLLTAGTYEVRVGVPTAGTGATYSYTASEIADVGCTNNGAMGDVTLPAQTLGGSDCTFNGKYEDRLTLLVDAGKTIEVTMEGTSVAPTAIIRDPASPPGTVLELQTRETTGTVTASFTTTVAGYYQVIFSTNQQGASGGYNGSIVVR